VYSTANEWYISLAEMHFAQVVFQQNNLVLSSDDCWNKYVARELFLNLGRKGNLSVFGFSDDNWAALAYLRLKKELGI
jgi:hypothetical protein